MISVTPDIGTDDAAPGRTDVWRQDDGLHHENGWRHLTHALLRGLVASSLLFFLIAAFQTPGLDPPPESAALFLVATASGVISLHLLRTTPRVGYPATALAGLVVLGVLTLILTGTYGGAGPRTNPIGPAFYAALAVAVVVSSGVAWWSETRTRSATTAVT